VELTPKVCIYRKIVIAKFLRYLHRQRFLHQDFHLATASQLSVLLSSIWNGQEPTTAVNSSSNNLEGHPGLAQLQYSSAGDSKDDTTYCAPPFLEQLSRAFLTAK